MRFIFIFVLVLLNTSCSILQSSKQPFWIDNPSTNTYIGSVAIVKNKSQKRLALIKARAYIVENIKSYLVSKATIKKNITNSKYSSSFTQEITQEAQGFIQDGFIKDSYVDKDGNYYIWFVVKKRK